jgi:hypothetical protein
MSLQEQAPLIATHHWIPRLNPGVKSSQYGSDFGKTAIN